MNRESGFTLLEVVLAAAVASIAIVSLLQLFAGSSRLAGKSVEQTHAMAVARSVIDRVLWETELEDGEYSDTIEGYSWIASVYPKDPEFGVHDEDDRLEDGADYELKQIDVTVNWSTLSGREQSLTLSTLRLMEKF